MRIVFATCVLCFGLAIYSGFRIVSDTHLHLGDEPSLIPGAPKSLHGDSIAALDQAQRIRASRLLISAPRRTSTFDLIADALNGR